MKRVLDYESNEKYAASLMRALLGAMVFSLPLFMTMEMWELGIAMDRPRLVLLLVLTFPALVGLSFYAGFERTFSIVDNVLDAFAAIAISAAACLGVLAAFGQVAPCMAASEVIGKLAVLSFGASIGALLADKQFNDADDEEDGDDLGNRNTAASRLFVMGVGAVFLALNIAPTDEIEIIAAAISPLQAGIIACLSVVILYIIQSAISRRREGGGPVHFLRQALSAYGLCLLICWYILWTFGRTDDVSLAEAVERTLVLAFPAALGAGAARLILGPRPDG